MGYTEGANTRWTLWHCYRNIFALSFSSQIVFLFCSKMLANIIAVLFRGHFPKLQVLAFDHSKLEKPKNSPFSSCFREEKIKYSPAV